MGDTRDAKSLRSIRIPEKGRRLTDSRHRGTVHNGKTISVYEVKLLDDKGELLETGTFTFYHMNREVLPETEA